MIAGFEEDDEGPALLLLRSCSDMMMMMLAKLFFRWLLLVLLCDVSRARKDGGAVVVRFDRGGQSIILDAGVTPFYLCQKNVL
jgi:hypothetical protein